MGNFLFPRCKSNTDINISENCIKRLTQERTPNELDLYSHVPLTEDQWMKKLRCIDEAHSKAYGLTPEAIQEQAAKVEEQLSPDKYRLCPTEKLMRCLQDNCDCTIKCKGVLDEFIDCVDTKRIQRVKETLIAEETKERQAKQNNQ